MTNNIKKAVGILNRLRERWSESITEDEYFFLLDFVIKVEGRKPDEIIIQSEQPLTEEEK